MREAPAREASRTRARARARLAVLSAPVGGRVVRWGRGGEGEGRTGG